MSVDTLLNDVEKYKAKLCDPKIRNNPEEFKKYIDLLQECFDLLRAKGEL